MNTLCHAAVGAVLVSMLGGCARTESLDSTSLAAGQAVKSQLRGYDLGPPFPAGLRDSGLVNGYAEGEWIPFVAVMEGRKLEVSDGLAGGVGDGRYGAMFIVPTYSAKNGANGISDLRVTGTYGQGDLTPIPSPFDDTWMVTHGYAPFVLGAYEDGAGEDLQPVITAITQRTGPTRFGGDVSSAAISVEFTASAAAERVELRFAVELAVPDLAPIAPQVGSFAAPTPGTALGAASFHPGPGPLFVGYQVGAPTGIATVPIRVDRTRCEDDYDCPSGDYCSGGECEDPCVDDAACPADEICEDGVCEPPPPPCVYDEDCGNDDVCAGGYCVPECPESCGDPELCDPDPCMPPDDTPPCVIDDHCNGGDRCEDGVCQPPQPPCDLSCPADDVCVNDVCVPPQPPCTTDGDCPGGTVCADGVCNPGIPPCTGSDCGACTYDAQCPGGYACNEGFCVPVAPPLPCTDVIDCPAGQLCTGGYCEPPTPCGPQGECGPGELCEVDTGTCVPVPCNNQNDCGADELCLGGYCEPPGGCTVDRDCPGGELCENGTCRPGQPPIPCEVSTECPPAGDDVWVPVCYDGFCRPGGGDCLENPDCPGGTVCETGVCVPADPPQACSQPYDCPGGELCTGGYCQPGSGVDECTTAADCAPNPYDDVGPACVGGLCTTSRAAPQPCGPGLLCGPGNTCTDNRCVPLAGACEVSTDCSGGDSCVTGWCGVACSTTGECATGVCTLGRCGTACTTYAQCGDYEACMGGGCVPLPAVVGHTGGDDAPWDVDLPAPVHSDLQGGCSTGGAPGGGFAFIIAMVMGLSLVRRRRLGSATFLVAVMALSLACGDPNEAAAGAPDASSAVEVDAAPASSDAAPGPRAPYALVTCQDEPSADAGAEGDAGPASCCDPYGLCPALEACIEGPTTAEHVCRPYCDPAADDCGDGTRCVSFEGRGVCIPASREGLECSPELCDAETICVGASADDAVCQRRCAEATDCDEGQICSQLLGSDTRACLEPAG